TILVAQGQKEGDRREDPHAVHLLERGNFGVLLRDALDALVVRSELLGDLVEHLVERREGGLQFVGQELERLLVKALARARWQTAAERLHDGPHVIDQLRSGADEGIASLGDCKLGLRLRAAMGHGRKKAWIRTLQSRQKLRVGAVALVVVL